MIVKETAFLDDVIQGLSQSRKSLPCKYFYDQHGSYYFERICGCKDYYLTRTEMAIMDEFMPQVVQVAGERRLVVEYGSGSAIKTRFLLRSLWRPAAYIPIDIFSEYLEDTVKEFSCSFPDLEIISVCADFTRPFELPQPQTLHKGKLIYFPGSTIGNFSPGESIQLLQNMFFNCSRGDLVLLGVDLKKPRHILDKAYNDDDGYTAAFNLNLLKRINRELNADFCVENFFHKAFYNEAFGRVEMHLVSACEQTATIDGQEFRFFENESIHTENSHKYNIQELLKLVESSGFSMRRIWTDRKEFFAMVLLEAG
jgi:dimethylhistidine N-methyltransferase